MGGLAPQRFALAGAVVTTRPSRADAVEKRVCVALFAVCLGLHLWSTLIGFTHPIGENHGFRQSQTAIAAYYQVQDGFSLDYATPVLGAPWSIPMEFPLYQWVVAATVRSTGMDLDQAGRLVALVFFYLGLPAIYLLFRQFGARRHLCLAPVCLVLVSPLYIYWSTMFMIESTALSLGFWFLWGFAAWLGARDFRALAVMMVCGALCGLVKATTFVVAAAPVVCYLSVAFFKDTRAWFAKDQAWKRQALGRWLGHALGLGAPLLAVIVWTDYADQVKALNPMAGFLQSAALKQWNFGTIEDRLDPSYWSWIVSVLRDRGIGSIFLLILLLPGLWSKKFRGPCLLGVTGFVAGPLVFANLYFVHYYYHYANVVFMLLGLAAGLLALFESCRTRWLGLVLLLTALCFSFASYLRTYYPEQLKLRPVGATAQFLRAVTDPDEVLLIYNQDWNPYTAYYAQRRALMNRMDWPLGHPQFMRAIELTGKERVVALLKEEPDFSLNKYFGFDHMPAMTNLYLRRDVRQRAFLRLFGVDVAASVTSMPLIAIMHEDRFRLLAAPPSRVVVPLPRGAGLVSFAFGLLNPDAPVHFSLGHVDAAGAYVRLYEMFLDPARMLQDRRVQQATVDCSKLGPGTLLLETGVPGAPAVAQEAEPIPAFWSDIQIR